MTFKEQLNVYFTLPFISFMLCRGYGNAERLIKQTCFTLLCYQPVWPHSGWSGIKTTPREDFLKLLNIGADQRPAPTFHGLKLSFTHFQSFLGCFHAPGKIFDSAKLFLWRRHLLVSDVNFQIAINFNLLSALAECPL